MASTSAAGGSRKSRPWTDEEKYQLLLRIVSQLQEGGRPIDWKKIELPGRTAKSLQNTWFQIKKTVSEFEDKDKASGGGSGVKSPAKGATPRKKTSSMSKAMAYQDAEEDDDDEHPPKKVARLKKSSETLVGGEAEMPKCEIKFDPEDGEIGEDLKQFLMGM